MLFVIHALDKNGEMPTRAKHYRDHRLHLDRAEDYDVDVITAGTLHRRRRRDAVRQRLRDRRRQPRRARPLRAERPYHVNGVWERVDIHGYSKKRGTPIISQRAS